MTAYMPELTGLGTEERGGFPVALGVTLGMAALSGATMAAIEKIGTSRAWPSNGWRNTHIATPESPDKTRILIGGGLGRVDADEIVPFYEQLGNIASARYATDGVTVDDFGDALYSYTHNNFDLGDPNDRLNVVTHSMFYIILMAGYRNNISKGRKLPKLGKIAMLSSPIEFGDARDGKKALWIASRGYKAGVLTKLGIELYAGLDNRRYELRRLTRSRTRDEPIRSRTKCIQDAFYNSCHGQMPQAWVKQILLGASFRHKPGEFGDYIDKGTHMAHFGDPDDDIVVDIHRARRNGHSFVSSYGATFEEVQTFDCEHADERRMAPYILDFMK